MFHLPFPAMHHHLQSLCLLLLTFCLQLSDIESTITTAPGLVSSLKHLHTTPHVYLSYDREQVEEHCASSAVTAIAVDVETAALAEKGGQEGDEGKHCLVVQHSKVRDGAVEEGDWMGREARPVVGQLAKVPPVVPAAVLCVATLETDEGVHPRGHQGQQGGGVKLTRTATTRQVVTNDPVGLRSRGRGHGGRVGSLHC